MDVKVNASAVVYAKIKLQTGDMALYFPDTGKTTPGGTIDLLSSFSLRGPEIVHGFVNYDTPSPKAVGISSESFVIIEEVPYAKAEASLLALSGNTYIPV